MLANETLVFIYVVKNGSITKASKQLGQTPAAVSKAISRLEGHHAVKLLHRTTRSVSMTEHGIMLYQRSESILDTLKDAENYIIQAQVNPKGRIKLGVPPAFAETILAKILPEFLKIYSDIEIELFLEKRREYPEPGEYDLLIKAGPLPDNNSFRAKQLVEWEHITCAAQSYLERYGTPKTPSDLESHICLDYNYRMTGRIWSFFKDEGEGKDMVQKKYKVNVQTNINTDAGIFMLSAARHGGGIIYVPKFTVKNDICNKVLIPILTDYYSKKMPVSLLHSYNSNAVPQKIRLLMDYIYKRVHELDYNNLDACLNDTSF